MRIRLQTLIVVGLLALSTSVAAHAQALACPPTDRNAEALLIYLNTTGTDTSAAAEHVRQGLGIQTLNSGQIAIETDSTVCGRVTYAITSALGWAPRQYSLIVARFGPLYVAYPRGSTGGAGVAFVVDSGFTYKKSLTAF
jgi:hypothetical protein